MKRATRAVLAVIIVAFSVPIFAGTATLNPSAPSWPKWRGPNGNGMIDEQAWNPASIDATRVLWSVKVGQGYSSACVVGGYVFTAGKPGAVQETLVCLDGATGATVWSFGYESGNVQYPGSRATPVFDNGKLYIMSLTGHAYCVDAQTGKKLWDMDIAGKTGAAMPSWGFAGSALIEGDLAMFNVCRSGAALDKETGKIVWKSADDAAGYATPVPFDYKGTRCLAVLGSKRLTVVEELTGREVAFVPWVAGSDVNVGDPLVIGDSIFVGSNYGTGCALFKLGDGKLTRTWANTAIQPHFSSAVYRDGYIYCNSGFAGSGYGAFVCLDAKDGKALWSADLGVGSLIGVGSILLITTETGSLIAARMAPSRFERVGTLAKAVPRLCWTAPVFAGGRIYLRSDKGDVICLVVP